MSTATLVRVFSAIRKSPRALIEAMLKRADRPAHFNQLESLESRQMLSAVPDWVNTLGTTGSSSVNSVVTADDGSVYAAGFFDGTVDFDSGAGVFNLTSLNDYNDGFLVKYNPDGTFAWARQFAGIAGTSDTFATIGDISIDDNSNIYVGGQFNNKLSVDFGAGATTLNSKGDSDIFIAKVTPAGSLSYIKQVGSNSTDQFISFASTRSDNVIFSGLTYGNLDLDVDPVTEAKLGNSLASSQSFLVGYNPDFTYQTHLVLRGTSGSAFAAFGESALIDGEDTLIISGNVKRDVDLFLADGTKLTSFSIPENTKAFGDDAASFVVSIDTHEGFVLNWSKTITSTRGVGAGPLVTDPAGNIYFGVNYTGDVDLDPSAGEANLTGGTQFIPALLSLDSSGNFRFGHGIGNFGEIRGLDITVNPVDSSDVTLFAVGDFSGTAQFDPAGSAAGKRSSNGSNGSGFLWVLDENGKFIDAAGFYSAKGGSATMGEASVRSIDAVFDGPVTLGGSFSGTVDFNASTGVLNRTGISTLSHDSNGFVSSFSSTGPTDFGGVVATGTTHKFSQGSSYTATVPGNNKVTFALTGPGSGIVTLSDTGELLSVIITGTKSTSNFTVTVAGSANGGTATIGSILIGADGDGTVDAIGSINAAKLNVFAGVVDVESSANSITLNNLNNVNFSIGAANTTGTSLKLGTVQNVSVTTPGAISSLDTLGGWDNTDETADIISATSIGKVNIKGDFEAGMVLTGVSKGNTLGNVTITGFVNASKWDVAGNTGIINAAGISNFTLDADIVQGFTVGKSGITTASLGTKSIGAFTIAGSADHLSLTLQAAGTSSKLLTNLASLSIAGTVSHLFVSSGSYTNLGAFTFKGAADHIDINGSTQGTIAGITGTSISDLDVTTGALTSLTFSGAASHVLLSASSKIGAVTFKAGLDDAVITLLAAPAKATSVFTSLTVTGNGSDIIINAANPNASVGSIGISGVVDDLQINATGDITSIKTGATNKLLVTKAGKIGSISVGGDLTNSAVDALAITGAFTIAGNVSYLDTTLNTSRSVMQPAGFKALGSMTVSGTSSEISVTAAGTNSNFGAFIFKGSITNGNITTPGDVGLITGASGNHLNVEGAKLAGLTIAGNVVDLNLQAASVTNFTIKGALTDSSFVIVNTAATAFTAFGPMTISGNVTNLDLLSANPLGKFGAITLGPSNTNVRLNISGDIASFKSGTLDGSDLISPGKIGAFTITGNLTDTNVDVLAMGTATISGNVSKSFLTVNTVQTKSQPTGFIALAGLTVAGTVDNFTLTAAGINSNVGALTFAKGIASGFFDIQGVTTSLTSKSSIDNFTGNIATLKALTISGNASNSSFSSDSIGSISVSGNVNALSLNLNALGSSAEAFLALSSMKVSGTANNLIISGTGFNSSIGSVDIAGNATGLRIEVNGNANKISANSYDANTVLSISGKLATLATGKTGDLNGSNTAGSFGTVTVGGNLTGELVSFGSAGIGSITVTGNITAGIIRAQGSIKAITANGILNSTIFSGYDSSLPDPVNLPTTSAGFIDVTAVIGTITLKSTSSSDSFVNSKIAGVKIGTVTLKLVDTTNAGTILGIAATKELGPVTRTDPANPTKTLKLNKITLPGQSVQINDFALRIVT